MSPLAPIRKLPRPAEPQFSLWLYDAFDGWIELGKRGTQAELMNQLRQEHERSGRDPELGLGPINGMGEHYGILPADRAYLDTPARRGR